MRYNYLIGIFPFEIFPNNFIGITFSSLPNKQLIF